MSTTANSALGDSVVLAQELGLLHVLLTEVDAVNVLRAALGEIQAEEAAVAPDVEHGLLGDSRPEELRDRAVDEVMAEEQVLDVRAHEWAVGLGCRSVVERPRHRPRRERFHRRAQLLAREVGLPARFTNELRPRAIDRPDESRQQVLGDVSGVAAFVLGPHPPPFRRGRVRELCTLQSGDDRSVDLEVLFDFPQFHVIPFTDVAADRS